MRLRLDKPDELIMRQKPDVKRGFDFIMVGIIGHDTSNGSRPSSTSVDTPSRSASLAISSALKRISPLSLWEKVAGETLIFRATSFCHKPRSASRHLMRLHSKFALYKSSFVMQNICITNRRHVQIGFMES